MFLLHFRPAVDIEVAAKSEVKNALGFGNGAHPLATRLLEVCQIEKKDQNAFQSAADQVKTHSKCLRVKIALFIVRLYISKTYLLCPKQSC